VARPFPLLFHPKWTQVLAQGWKSLFENPGVIEVQELHEVFVHFENHSLVHQIVRHSSDSWGKKFEFAVFA